MNQSSPESGGGDSSGDASPISDASNPLDAVLEATLSQGRRSINPEEWDRLRHVTALAQQSGEPMDRWCVSMVRALLEMRMPDAVMKTKSLDHMSLVIASTLCSDPASKQRLIELQNQLLENRL